MPDSMLGNLHIKIKDSVLTPWAVRQKLKQTRRQTIIRPSAEYLNSECKSLVGPPSYVRQGRQEKLSGKRMHELNLKED